MIIPNIVERNFGSEKIYDIYSKLLKDRIIFINGEITDSMSHLIISQLLYLDSVSSDDISIYINSPGGSVTAGLSIYDCMNYIKSDVSTVATGLCASMAAIILAAGTKGKRYSLKNSEIMIHQVLGGAQGQASDIKIQAERILIIKKKLNKILASLCGQTINKINKDTERDYYLSADDAIKYGLIDSII